MNLSSHYKMSCAVFKIPKIVMMFIVLNLALYAAVQYNPDAQAYELIQMLALIPSEFSVHLNELYRLLTYAFLHASFTHLALNMLWYVVFGTVVARMMSTAAFSVFISLTAIGAGLIYVMLNAESESPMLGASGIVSGFMGASLHVMPYFYDAKGRYLAGSGRINIQTNPIQAVMQALQFSPAWQFVGLFHVLNLISAVQPILFGAPSAIAWEVHIAGFWIGAVLMPVLAQRVK